MSNPLEQLKQFKGKMDKKKSRTIPTSKADVARGAEISKQAEAEGQSYAKEAAEMKGKKKNLPFPKGK